MVTKLMKHELIALFRVVIFPAATMLLLAVLFRISLIGEIRMQVLLGTFYGFALTATMLVCFAMGVMRFSKSFFSGEGYMTLSLPVTASQLIWAKLLTALLTMLFGVVVCLLSTLVFLIGVDPAVLESIGRFFESVGANLASVISSEPVIVIEMILLMIVGIPAALLEFYFVISVGQMFTTRNRKGMTAVIYLVGFFIMGMISTFLTQPVESVAIYVSVHLAIWILILLQAAIDVACFLSVRYILTHKVNLVA